MLGQLFGLALRVTVWGDEFLPVIALPCSPQASKGVHFNGASICLASLLVTGRYEQLLALSAVRSSRSA